MPLDPILFRAQHIFSIKGQIVNKLGIVDPNKSSSPHNYWPLPLQCESGHAQDSNEWAWLDANKTLFIKGGRKPDLANSQLADPLSPSVSWEDLQGRGLTLLLAASSVFWSFPVYWLKWISLQPATTVTSLSPAHLVLSEITLPLQSLCINRPSKTIYLIKENTTSFAFWSPRE